MAPRRAPPQASMEVTGAQLRRLAVDVLSEQLPLVVTGDRYATADVYAVLLAAAVQQRSVESVGQQLVDAPSANTVRDHLADQVVYGEGLDTLEAQCNAVLVAHLPDDVVSRPQRVAIDLTLLPYYGRPAIERGELRRGEAKAGTTRCHAYATAYLVRDGRRLTLART
jgi:hypothetical protein